MDIITAIDQATGCHQCGQPLGGSPSSDFCSESCQRVWHAQRSASPLLSEASEISLRSAPTQTAVALTAPASFYGNSGMRWISITRDAEIRPLPYFEWRTVGIVVDNSAAD